MTLKCKPCYNFQSVEFDYEIDMSPTANVTEQLNGMFAFYELVVDGLKEVAPEQPDKVRKPTEPLATEGQKNIMKQYGIEFTDRTTKKEAQLLIQKSIEEASR